MQRLRRVDGRNRLGTKAYFIGVRRGYEWGEGSYSLRVEGQEIDGEGRWFGLFIVDLHTGVETWIG